MNMSDDVSESFAKAITAYAQMRTTLPENYFDEFTMKHFQDACLIMWGKGRECGLLEAQAAMRETA